MDTDDRTPLNQKSKPEKYNTININENPPNPISKSNRIKRYNLIKQFSSVDDESQAVHRCNENIYNAFLISHFADDLHLQKRIMDAKKAQSHSMDDLNYSLGFAAYLTALAQWTGIFILIYLCWIINDTKGIRQVFEQFTFWPETWYFLAMWPFFFNAVIVALSKIGGYHSDDKVLSITIHNKRRNRSYMIHKFILKDATELILALIGGFLYPFFLALFGDGNKLTKAFSTILGLLAYNFIFDMDEEIYKLYKRQLKAVYLDFSGAKEPENGFFAAKPKKRQYKFVYSGMLPCFSIGVYYTKLSVPVFFSGLLLVLFAKSLFILVLTIGIATLYSGIHKIHWFCKGK